MRYATIVADPPRPTPHPPPSTPAEHDALCGFNGERAVVLAQGPALLPAPPRGGIIPGRPATGYTRRNAPPDPPRPQNVASACDLLARCVPYPDLAGPLTEPPPAPDDRPVWPLLYDDEV